MADKAPLDPLHWATPIVDNAGRPTQEFMRKWGAQSAINQTIPDVSGGAAGALLYKLSADNLDVGWSAGLVWDEANDTLSFSILKVGDSPYGGQRISAYYDVATLPAGSSVAFNFFARGAADAGGTTVLSAANLISEITGGNNVNQLFGFKAEAWMAGTGTLNVGVVQSCTYRQLAGGTTADGRGINAGILASAGTITTGCALFANTPTVSGTGAVGTAYGARVRSQKVTGVTKGYGVYSEGTSDLNVLAGRTTIGSAADPTASAALDVNSTTGAFLPPRMTTTQRNALTASNGMEVYDTTVGAFFDYTAGAWVQRGSGGGGGGSLAVVGANAAFSLGSAQAVGTSEFLGRMVVVPENITVSKLVVMCQAVQASNQLAPAIYAVTSGNALGALLGSGSLVTGRTVGANVLNLTTPVALTAGQIICYGFSSQVANFNMCATPSEPYVMFTMSGASFPNPPTSVTYTSSAGTGAMWLST